MNSIHTTATSPHRRVLFFLVLSSVLHTPALLILPHLFDLEQDPPTKPAEEYTKIEVLEDVLPEEKSEPDSQVQEDETDLAERTVQIPREKPVKPPDVKPKKKKPKPPKPKVIEFKTRKIVQQTKTEDPNKDVKTNKVAAVTRDVDQEQAPQKTSIESKSMETNEKTSPKPQRKTRPKPSSPPKAEQQTPSKPSAKTKPTPQKTPAPPQTQHPKPKQPKRRRSTKRPRPSASKPQTTPKQKKTRTKPPSAGSVKQNTLERDPNSPSPTSTSSNKTSTPSSPSSLPPQTSPSKPSLPSDSSPPSKPSPPSEPSPTPKIPLDINKATKIQPNLYNNLFEEKDRKDSERVQKEEHDKTFVGRWQKRADQMKRAMMNFDLRVRPGNQIKIRTKSDRNAVYINAIHRKIHARWALSYLQHLDMRYPMRHRLSNPKLHALLELAIDANTGNIETCSIHKTSGVLEYDLEAVRICHAVSPAPKAPKGIVSPDGRVYIHWNFWRGPRQCGTFGVSIFVLTQEGAVDSYNVTKSLSKQLEKESHMAPPPRKNQPKPTPLPKLP